MIVRKGTEDKRLRTPQDDSSRKSVKLSTLIDATVIISYYILRNQTCNCGIYDAKYPLRASSDMCHSYERIS